MTPEMLDAWRHGKLDVECAACGIREAASVRCSACLHVHDESDYRLHSDTRALHYSPPPTDSAPRFHAKRPQVDVGATDPAQKWSADRNDEGSIPPVPSGADRRPTSSASVPREQMSLALG